MFSDGVVAPAGPSANHSGIFRIVMRSEGATIERPSIAHISRETRETLCWCIASLRLCDSEELYNWFAFHRVKTFIFGAWTGAVQHAKIDCCSPLLWKFFPPVKRAEVSRAYKQTSPTEKKRNVGVVPLSSVGGIGLYKRGLFFFYFILLFYFFSFLLLLRAFLLLLLLSATVAGD